MCSTFDFGSMLILLYHRANSPQTPHRAIVVNIIFITHHILPHFSLTSTIKLPIVTLIVASLSCFITQMLMMVSVGSEGIEPTTWANKFSSYKL